ncbi:MAG: Gfo/Idh/MocA family oxidoreductase, partial [Syntrophales bacterium]|nr:Gfo/Idh/MocA family oxidoreductase [Syntrophales bacterium]
PLISLVLMIKIGLIGAGAIARQVYLPFFKCSSTLDLRAIVETDDKIRKDLSHEWAIPYIGNNIDKALDYVDAVIICVPNYLHYSIAKRCLENGKHILCEKPVCIRSSECRILIALARSNSLAFTVAHTRRFYPAVKIIKELVDCSHFGILRGFDFREGVVFNWPTLSGYIFDKKRSGGGVLLDIGAHLLDLLFWWVEGDVSSFSYMDDNMGGLESTAEISVNFTNGISGYVKLTRLAVLNNAYTLYFEHGSLSWNPFISHRILVRDTKGRLTTRSVERENPIHNLLDDFSSAIRAKKSPAVKGEEALKVLEFVEACYGARKPIPMSWLAGRN